MKSKRKEQCNDFTLDKRVRLTSSSPSFSSSSFILSSSPPLTLSPSSWSSPCPSPSLSRCATFDKDRLAVHPLAASLYEIIQCLPAELILLVLQYKEYVDPLDHTRYDGEWNMEHEKNGSGMIFWPNGDWLSGEWEKDAFWGGRGQRSQLIASLPSFSSSSSSSSLPSHPSSDCDSTAFYLVHGFIISTDFKNAIAWMDSLTSSSWNSPLLSPKNKTILVTQMVHQALQLRDVPLAESLFDRARTQWKAVPDHSTYSTLIDGILNASRSTIRTKAKDAVTIKALRYMKQMEKDGIAPTVREYNSFVNYYASRGEMDKATAAIAEMKKRNISPDQYTVGLLIRGYAFQGNMVKARAVFNGTRNMIQVQPSHILSLLSGYCRVGDIASAEKLLRELHQSDRTASIIDERMVSTIIHHYARAGHYDRSLALLKEMAQWGIQPTAEVYGEVIAGMCLHRDTDHASQMLDEMLELRMRPSPDVFGILVSTMVVQGQMVKAEAAFARAKEAQAVDSLIYSSLIRGFIIQKDLVKAFHYVDEMHQHPGHLRFSSSLFLTLTDRYGSTFRSHDPQLYQQCLSLCDKNILYNKLHY
eukprot:TRINITY_DN605_c1_g2_i3.p1 TRINITY_DN605_c1_g2~~TRINITY_DN605_c1_g2_i3.p1  ORF type:complete len:587 (-),score=181.87 TRINITY_DN605_c1_g2_i3:123-1883(-)